jgi:hypothetical protein
VFIETRTINYNEIQDQGDIPCTQKLHIPAEVTYTRIIKYNPIPRPTFFIMGM